jgi:hypothetical protein
VSAVAAAARWCDQRVIEIEEDVVDLPACDAARIEA